MRDELSLLQRKVHVAYHRLGGWGSQDDIRKRAGKGFGSPIANKLIALGLIRRYQHDDYGLTPEGYEVVKLLIE
jgi:hypothetical protein